MFLADLLYKLVIELFVGQLVSLFCGEVVQAERFHELAAGADGMKGNDNVDPILRQCPHGHILGRANHDRADVGVLLAELLDFCPIRTEPVVNNILAVYILGKAGDVDIHTRRSEYLCRLDGLAIHQALQPANGSVGDLLNVVYDERGMVVGVRIPTQAVLPVQLVDNRLRPRKYAAELLLAFARIGVCRISLYLFRL